MIDNYEKEYRQLMLRIGGAMLFFLAVSNILGILQIKITDAVASGLNYKANYIFSSLFGSAIYLLSFFLPGAFFYLISKKKSAKAILSEVRLDKNYVFMLVAGIATVFTAAVINSYIVSLIGFGDYMDQLVDTEPLDENYKLILEVIATALVPAFCEEFLFRGVFLTNLLPYGKTNAVITSAVLFGLMHQNPGQIFYTIVAGIVIGLIYVRTRSIWGGILLHFFNNLFSVVEQVIVDRLPLERADFICSVIEMSLFLLGIASAVILICAERKRKKVFSESGFGVLLEPDEDYTERKLPDGRAAKRFFVPTVTVFFCIVCAEMLFLIILPYMA